MFSLTENKIYEEDSTMLMFKFINWVFWNAIFDWPF